MYYGSRSIQIHIGLDTRLQFVLICLNLHRHAILFLYNVLPRNVLFVFLCWKLEVMPNIRENLFVASPICMKYTL